MEAVSVRRHVSRAGDRHSCNGNGSDPESPRGSCTEGESEENGQQASSNQSTAFQSSSWTNHQVPGGRKLWNRLVIGFAVVASLGAVFVTLGAVYFKDAKEWSDRENLSLPVVLCIIAMVMGVLLIAGSFVLGKLIISDKWRKNEQPTYRNMATASVHYRNPAPTDPPGAEPQVDIQMHPPSYEASANDPTSPPPNVFVISGRDININMSPPSSHNIPPPSYTENSEIPPPAYIEIPLETVAEGGQTSHSPGGSTVQENTAPKPRTNSTDLDVAQVHKVLTGRMIKRSSSSSTASSDASSTTNGSHSRSLSLASFTGVSDGQTVSDTQTTEGNPIFSCDSYY